MVPLLAVLLCLLGLSCGSSDTGGAAGSEPGAGDLVAAIPDSQMSSALSTPGRGGEGGDAREITPTKGLVDIRKQPWDDVDVLSDEEQLRIFFYGGVRACYGLDRYEVAYGVDDIVVTLFAGRKPNVDVCIDIAKRFSVTVPLREPVGGREIVDGGQEG